MSDTYIIPPAWVYSLMENIILGMGIAAIFVGSILIIHKLCRAIDRLYKSEEDDAT